MACWGGPRLGNPNIVARSINWNAGLVGHHAMAADAIFAVVQILLGLGIAWRPTVKPALALSIPWALGVWWFGEGLGAMLTGKSSPIAGEPGAVLLYALLAILLWPADRAGSHPPFAAARAVGVRAARAIWAALWFSLAVLTLIGAGRSGQGVHDLIGTLATGEPHWLAWIDHHVASLLAQRGVITSIVLAALFVVVAAGVYLPGRAPRIAVGGAIIISAVIWVVGQNFGTIFAGGQATDPNSGLLLILVAFCYWPAQPLPVNPGVPSPATVVEAI